MSDAVTSELKESRSCKPEVTGEIVLVTGIVTYDLFPYYNVLKGELREDGSFRAPGIGVFRPGSDLLRILSPSAYEKEDKKRVQIQMKYREKEKQLRVDILEEFGVDFLPSAE